MKTLAIIPARMSSSRFPNKPLKNIANKPMLYHVYKRAEMFFKKQDLFIATCDAEIMNFSKSINANSIMTSNKHKRASDRVYEAMKKIENMKKFKYDLIVLLQGDEPLINPSMLKKAINPFKNNKSIKVLNLMKKIDKIKDALDPNEVKVVFDKNNNALYFSRHCIPFNHINGKTVYFKQVCVIPFRRDFLIEYSKMKPTKYEVLESIDMMRVIENGYKVKLVEIKDNVISVDTLNDLKKAELLIKKDKYTKKY